MTSWNDIVGQVRERAGYRCEYCQMHQALQGATFHVEHIIPSVRGGPSTLDNLAWCCPICNLKKSDRIEVPDAATGLVVPFYHPRNDRWADHFRLDVYRVVGLTAVGRATAEALGFNHPRRALIRRAEEIFGLFPP